MVYINSSPPLYELKPRKPGRFLSSYRFLMGTPSEWAGDERKYVRVRKLNRERERTQWSTIPKVIQGHKQNSNQACNNNMYECWKNIKIFHVMNCCSKFFFFPEHYVNMLLWWIVRHGVSLRIHCPQSHWTAVVQSKIIYIQNLEWPGKHFVIDVFLRSIILLCKWPCIL